MREQKAVGSYYRLAPKERMDVIIYHFNSFPSIIKDYEMELEDWIMTNRSMARQESRRELGVRIQSNSCLSSPTANMAIERLQIEGMIKNGTLGELERSLEDLAEIERGIMEVKLMRHEYRRMKVRIGTLNKVDRELLVTYACRESTSSDLSEELMITQKSVRNKIYRIKKKLLNGFGGSFDSYTDDTIMLLSNEKGA